MEPFISSNLSNMFLYVYVIQISFLGTFDCLYLFVYGQKNLRMV
jgi:hypothetical protein